MSEDYAILLDLRPLRYYDAAHWESSFVGGTEQMAGKIAHGLGQRGHTVHVLANGLEHEERRGETEWWWGPNGHPTGGDFVFAVSSLETIGDLRAPLLVLLPNGIDPYLFGREDQITGVACFSQNHIDLMTKISPITRDKCFITGLGVDSEEYETPDYVYARDVFSAEVRAEQRVGTSRGGSVYGRMLWANDPARGLLPMLDIFDHVRAAIPEASLHITYDFDRQFAQHQWSARCMGEILWECKRRIESTPGVVSLGGLTHAEVVREQMECQVHVMPSDPPNTGSQIHGMTQIECAAAGVPLVLSDIEAFPELFGGIARLLPVVGSMRGRTIEGEPARVDAQDWADVVIEIMQDPVKWVEMSEASRTLARQHSWHAVIDRFEEMMSTLAGRLVPA